MSQSFKLTTNRAEWESAVSTLPNQHPLQSWTWGAFKGRWGWQPHHLLWDNAAALVLERKLPRLPFSILYVPRGPVFDHTNVDLQKQILSDLKQFTEQRKAVFLKLDPPIAISNGVDPDAPEPNEIGNQFVANLKSKGYVPAPDQIQFPNTVMLEIGSSPDKLLASFKNKTRYNIRLAGRKGIEIRQGTVDDLPLIAAMYTETATRDDFAIRPLEYYLDLWQSFIADGNAQPLIAEFEGDPIAAVVMLKADNLAIYFTGASTHKERNRMPNFLLQWEAIRWAQEQGCTRYDFWGAPDNFDESDSMWGVWRFKRGFQGDVFRGVGAWDFVNKPILYNAYTNLMPKLLDFLRNRNNNS